MKQGLKRSELKRQWGDRGVVEVAERYLRVLCDLFQTFTQSLIVVQLLAYSLPRSPYT